MDTLELGFHAERGVEHDPADVLVDPLFEVARVVDLARDALRTAEQFAHLLRILATEELLQLRRCHLAQLLEPDAASFFLTVAERRGRLVRGAGCADAGKQQAEQQQRPGGWVKARSFHGRCPIAAARPASSLCGARYHNRGVSPAASCAGPNSVAGFGSDWSPRT